MSYVERKIDNEVYRTELDIVEQVSVVFFGGAGGGKSTLANMLIQDDLNGEIQFPINDSPVGSVSDVTCYSNKRFLVHDTIGLCEPLTGETITHSKAIKKIRKHFLDSKPYQTLNYICYVKKGNRITNEDEETFKEFKKMFRGGEMNFIIIITNSTQTWVDKNMSILRGYYENYPIVGVNFPFNDHYNHNIQREIRIRSKKHLISSLLKLKYKAVKLGF